VSVVNARNVFSGRRFSVYVEEHVLPNGRRTTREVVRFPETVVILPLLDSETIVLLKQYRAPIREWIYELPAGVVDKGEKPEETAARELIEETGYKPGRLERVYPMYLAPGYSTEKIHAFIASDLEEVGARPEEYEVIETYRVKLLDALDMIRDGRICDAKTIALIMYYYVFIYNREKH